MNRAILAATVVTAIVLLTAPAAHACACCETYRVHGVADDDTLNVRTGPGTDFNVEHRLPPDTGCLTLTGEKRGIWVYVKGGYDDGTEFVSFAGWVSRKFLKFWPGPS